MNKVCKVYLISKTKDKDGNEIEYKDICKILWDLQKQTREVKNKTVQECWEWLGFSNDYSKKNDGTYPKDRDILLKEGRDTGYSLDGFIYDKYKDDYDLYSSNLSTTMRETSTAFKNAQKDMLKGTKSVLEYKSNQPLDVHGGVITLDYDKDTKKFNFSISLLKKSASKERNLPTGKFAFEAVVKDGSTRSILERCYDGVYGISASKLIYDKKKKQWKLNLSYSFDKKDAGLDPDRILGVNLGVVYPICASVYGDMKRLIIAGDEIIAFRNRVEARRNSLQKQSAVCGDGRIGHGYKTRMRPVLNIGDKIARFRDTFNHKASRRVIEYAVKNNCGVIQLEDLTGITEDADVFLKNWSYYDLQHKIEYKAKEVGIEVRKIPPRFTSQRCPKCGAIYRSNHPSRAKFHCVSCGYETLHDYNASQNIAIKDIDKIISAAVDKGEIIDLPDEKEKGEKETS